MNVSHQPSQRKVAVAAITAAQQTMDFVWVVVSARCFRDAATFIYYIYILVHISLDRTTVLLFVYFQYILMCNVVVAGRQFFFESHNVYLRQIQCVSLIMSETEYIIIEVEQVLQLKLKFIFLRLYKSSLKTSLLLMNIQSTSLLSTRRLLQ